MVLPVGLAGATVLVAGLGELWARVSSRFGHPPSPWIPAVAVSGLLFASVVWAAGVLVLAVRRPRRRRRHRGAALDPARADGVGDDRPRLFGRLAAALGIAVALSAAAAAGIFSEQDVLAPPLPAPAVATLGEPADLLDRVTATG